MPTECSATLFEFPPLDGRQVVASFDGGAITTDAGALLLGQTDRAIRLTERFAACFADTRTAELVEHQVETMVMQRVVGVALGYEDLNDHDELRHDPVLAVLAGKLEAQRSDCAPLAGKSHAEPAGTEPRRAHPLPQDQPRPRSYRKPVRRAVPRRSQEGTRNRSSSTLMPPTTRCTGSRKAASSTAIMTAYCYLPLYIFCGRHSAGGEVAPRRPPMPAAGAVEAERPPGRTDPPALAASCASSCAGIAASAGRTMMAWCEANAVDYVFGLGA